MKNIPLLEAMKRQIIPVSTNHTAMKDFINEDNAFIINSKLDSNALENNFKFYKPDFNSAILALESSYKATKNELKRKREKSLNTIKKLFDEKKVYYKIINRINSIKKVIND